MEYDVVDKAEGVIKSLKDEKERIGLTKSQIRKFLSAVNTIKNKADVFASKHRGMDMLPGELADEIKFLRVSILYQAGREKAVKKFVENADLEKIISDIGTDSAKFYKFCKYIEALVAFHKYHGGRD